MAAGIQEKRPSVDSAPSREGMINDHTEAAIITPAAKPRRMELVRLEISPRKQYTSADPAVVARKMRVKPRTVRYIKCYLLSNSIDVILWGSEKFALGNNGICLIFVSLGYLSD